MEIAIIILSIIVVFLIICLFFIKKDLKRICKSIQTIHKSDSNNLIHSEIPIKEINELINEINHILKQSKSEKIEFERKNIELKKIMTNISHDLRTPLTSALGYIDILLSAGDMQEDGRAELEIVKERLKRLEELISSFFEFSKLILQNHPVTLEKVNLLAILEESIAGHYEDYDKYNRSILLENHMGKRKITSNREMLARVFDNLIRNAWKHSRGDLFIRAEDKGGILQLRFTNELLYSDLDTDHIFDEFYTIDIARTKGNTGLGLAIAKEFVETLGGTIYAEKEKGNLHIVVEL